MPAYTAQELIDRAAGASDMHDNFVSSSLWLQWASLERYALELFMARSGWPIDFSSATITVTGAEAGTYSLAGNPDMMAIVCVHRLVSGGLQRLEYDDAVTFLRQVPGSPIDSGDARKYRVKRAVDGIALQFYPEPQVGDQLVVTYIPAPTRLTVTTDAVNYPMGWEERVVLGMARRAMDKEESDSRAIQIQMREMDSQIEELCWNRVMSESPKVRNADHYRADLPAREAWAWL
jgi:hypothetical protein